MFEPNSSLQNAVLLINKKYEGYLLIEKTYVFC